ncbi:MOSC domain-containing protein [Maribius pontilimi]|uniref:MOSC domain-containing protein n=1 Tax=Palleronia pontilimi TaxID=1964209 RepID=A0A934MDV6_9RHOB|nr:MOSC domain-containing protein [Palleronia pontilimi]MBJ3763890.1 MOSC domain-containing protein [Palleronia pontilimi]
MVGLREMMERHARAGRVDWIGLRGARRETVRATTTAEIDESGLVGDHARAGKRAVTLIQAEHLPVIADLLNRGPVPPEILRRNIVVSGINLAALRKERVQIGDAVLRIEGPCPPCSRMEEYLGTGGYSAVRGHGGYYASVEIPGAVRVGDSVTLAR